MLPIFAKIQEYSRQLFLCIGILFVGLMLNEQVPKINDFPSGQHTWAQSDHWALMDGFVENNLDFFHPQTFTHTKQFPHHWQHVHESTTTPTNFPVHAYLPAIAKKLFQLEGPWPMRTFLLVIGIIGGLYMLRLYYESSGQSILATLFALVILFSSPLYIDYFTKYLPTSFSLSVSFIAWYYYWKHLQDQRFKWLNLALLLFGIAALNRLIFILPLAVVLLQVFFRLLQKEKFPLSSWIIALLGISTIAGWSLWCSHLSEQNGSVFLSALLPPENFQQFLDHLGIIENLWLWHLLTPPTLILLLILLLLGIGSKSIQHSPRWRNSLLWYWLAALCFFLIMFRQYHAHDYYFLDTFFAPLIFSLGFLLAKCSQSKLRLWTIGGPLILLAFVGTTFQFSVPVLHERHQELPWDDVPRINREYSDLSRFLDDHNVGQDSKIFVFKTPAPNLPFLHLKRKGMLVHYHERRNYLSAMNWDFDYALIDLHTVFQSVLPIFPELPQYLKVCGHVPGYLLAEKDFNPERKVADWFSKTPSKQIILQQNTGLNKADSWENTAEKNEVETIKVYADNEFSWKLAQQIPTQTKELLVEVSGQYSGPINAAPILVFHSTNPNHQRQQIELTKCIEQDGSFHAFFVLKPGPDFTDNWVLYPWNIHRRAGNFSELQISQTRTLNR